MIVYAGIECMLYNGHSLKEKRSVLKPIMARLKNELNVAVAEMDYHHLWQRTKLGIVTVSNDYKHAEQVIQKALQIMDSYGDLERTITTIDRL